jgi:hypothetical protein
MPTTARIAMIKRIEEIYSKLKQEALVSNELEELVQLTAKLHESAVILRYKAAEERVFDKKLETIEKAEKSAKPENREVEAETVIDFSVFDETEEEVKDDTKVEEEKTVEIETPIELNFDNEIEEEKESVQQEAAEPEVKIEEVIEKASEPEPVVQAKEEKGDWAVYFKKIFQEHSTGLQTPLSSLAGSFGLNERILYINTLFDSEAEQFSETIQKLDGIKDWNACVPVLSKFAEERNWDKADDTTGEFILHVKRRYA